eukprot:scaffold20775_cov109-Isochrysis_galbana.AAC.11
MVPLRIGIDPFEPTAAELAGDEPPSETAMHTERQARTRLYASRATTPNNTHSNPNLRLHVVCDYPPIRWWLIDAYLSSCCPKLWGQLRGVCVYL